MRVKTANRSVQINAFQLESMKSLPVDDNLAQTNNITLNRGQLNFSTLKFAINDVPGSCTSLRQPNQQRRYTTQKKPDRKGVTERRAFFHQDASTLNTGRNLGVFMSVLYKHRSADVSDLQSVWWYNHSISDHIGRHLTIC
jgi:hypothetical protein